MAFFGLLAGAAKGLAKAGIIRGAVGKALGYTRPSVNLPVSIHTGGGFNPNIGPGGIRFGMQKIGPGFIQGSGTPFRTGGKFQGVQGGSSSTAPGMRRRRKMNPTNFRALDRALRRISGFEKRARKVLRITRPGAKASLKIKRGK